jgi:magnesium chelatase family protein
MTADQVEKYCILTSAAEEIIKKAFDKLNLSVRGYHKILKVARTIADLASHDEIDVAHIQEAIMYRSLNRSIWFCPNFHFIPIGVPIGRN